MRPNQNEYPRFYATYVNTVPDVEILSQMEQQSAEGLAFYQNIPSDQWDKGYAPGKWTLKELLVHMIDTERIFAYRAMRISRGDKTPLPGFEQDGYVVQSNANERNTADIIEEFNTLRQSTLCLFKSFSEEMIGRTGTASNGTISVRAQMYIIAGHELHHLNIIKERYLG